MKSDSRTKSFYSHLQSIDVEKLSGKQYLSRLHQLFHYAIIALTESSSIQFTTLFSRLSYLISIYSIEYKESYVLHSFRKLELEEIKKVDEGVILMARLSIDILGKKCFGGDIVYDEMLEITFERLTRGINKDEYTYHPGMRVLIKDIDLSNHRAFAQLEQEPFNNITIGFDRSDRNEDYHPLFSDIYNGSLYPLYCRIHDVEIDSKEVYYPSSFIFEPDLLFDVTSVSECFGAFAIHPLGYLLRRFVSKPASIPLIVGNLSNYFLDQLIYYPDINFSQLSKSIFQLFPLALVRLDDYQVKELMNSLKIHFGNIQKVVKEDLPKLGLTKEDSYIEPSFYSSKYGIQGRLDLFAYNDQAATIVELKSGMPFRPNTYGMSNNHYHQTLLYDMLIESVFGGGLKRRNFLLYSKVPDNHLRYAPTLKSEQREALKMRNQLYILDKQLERSADIVDFLHLIKEKNTRAVKGYIQTDLSELLHVLGELDQLERAYCTHSVQFVIREQFLSKIGDESGDRFSGLASLWRQDIHSKKEQFNILNHLEIIANHTMEAIPTMVLEKSPLTAHLSNFRLGDLAVFYPDQNRKDSILRHQVFKCTIIKISEKNIEIRLRSQQENPAVFRQHQYWNLEHDVLENGFYSMTRNVIQFVKSSKRKRRLLMSVIPPKGGKNIDIAKPKGLTEEQFSIYKSIVSTEDYFLLWGPPGTGKTSIIFKEVVEFLIRNTADRLLLMAYTNRAVDEMCKALLSIDKDLPFVRIGSNNSVRKDYHQYLLNNQTAQILNRKELLDFLLDKQIYVGTVASLMGKTDLFDIVKFDYAIVDEASQILEPALVGLLSKVSRFTLIGDHLQLPAIVLQNPEQSKVKNDRLRDLGIRNFANSLFERMYRIATHNKWEHAIGNLTFQGRMHMELMSFPNECFYDNLLHRLPGLKRLVEDRLFKTTSDRTKILAKERRIFIPCKMDLTSNSIKMNEDEASKVVLILEDIRDLYAENNMPIKDESIGVITPFRAQISRIIQLAKKSKGGGIDKVTVDTVERYQGGARDIIVFSTSVNFSFQLDSLVSLSEFGVDRKLNVAYTRAREQFILIGNEEILATNKTYRRLIQSCYRLEL